MINVFRIAVPFYIMKKQYDDEGEENTKACIRIMRDYIIFDSLYCLYTKQFTSDMFLHHFGGAVVNTLLITRDELNWETKNRWVFLESLTSLTALKRLTGINMRFPSIACIALFRLPYFLSLYKPIKIFNVIPKTLYTLLTMHVLIDMYWLKLLIKK